MLGLVTAAAAIAVVIYGSTAHPGAGLAVAAFVLSASVSGLVAVLALAALPWQPGAGKTGGRPVPQPGRIAPPRQLPVRLRQFRGRDADLQALEAELTLLTRKVPRTSWKKRSKAHREQAPEPAGPPQTGPAIVLIEGMPGIGKTALAQELAHRLAGSFPEGQLLCESWLRGRSAGLCRCAARLPDRVRCDGRWATRGHL